MNNNYVFTLFESAEQFGLIFTLLPFGNDIRISIPMNKSFCNKSISEMETKELNSIYNDLNDKERLEFWYKFIELNEEFFPGKKRGVQNA